MYHNLTNLQAHWSLTMVIIRLPSFPWKLCQYIIFPINLWCIIWYTLYNIWIRYIFHCTSNQHSNLHVLRHVFESLITFTENINILLLWQDVYRICISDKLSIEQYIVYVREWRWDLSLTFPPLILSCTEQLSKLLTFLESGQERESRLGSKEIAIKITNFNSFIHVAI